MYSSVHKPSIIQHRRLHTRTALFPRRCAQRRCTPGFLHTHPSIIAKNRLWSRISVLSRCFPALPARQDPGQARSVPGRWQQPLAGGTEHPPLRWEGNIRQKERSHSVFAEHLLGVPTENAGASFSPSFSPPSQSPNNHYFSFPSFPPQGAQREQSSPIVSAVSIFHPLKLMSAPRCRI